MFKAILATIAIFMAVPALGAAKCYIEKDPKIQVTMWTNVQSTNPQVEGFMYGDTPFMGNCTNKINGFCLAVDTEGKVYSFFKENQTKTIPLKECR